MGQRASAPTHWVPDTSATECSVCRRKFSVVLRRHHCRQCGQLCCRACSKGRCAAPGRGLAAPVRVCDVCLITLGARSREQSPAAAPSSHAAGRRTAVTPRSARDAVTPPRSARTESDYSSMPPPRDDVSPERIPVRRGSSCTPRRDGGAGASPGADVTPHRGAARARTLPPRTVVRRSFLGGGPSGSQWMPPGTQVPLDSDRLALGHVVRSVLRRRLGAPRSAAAARDGITRLADQIAAFAGPWATWLIPADAQELQSSPSGASLRRRASDRAAVFALVALGPPISGTAGASTVRISARGGPSDVPVELAFVHEGTLRAAAASGADAEDENDAAPTGVSPSPLMRAVGRAPVFGLTTLLTPLGALGGSPTQHHDHALPERAWLICDMQFDPVMHAVKVTAALESGEPAFRGEWTALPTAVAGAWFVAACIPQGGAVSLCGV